jgi:uncharacterized protein YnzC (UPF0291/DUF896 family)
MNNTATHLRTNPSADRRLQTAPKAAKTTISAEKKEEKSSYSPEFIAMMEQNMADFRAGKWERVSVEEFFKMLEIEDNPKYDEQYLKTLRQKAKENLA